MSLYGKYIKEREGVDIIEVEHGYITYVVLENGDYHIRDVFVEKDYRRTGVMTQLGKAVEDIARKNKAKYLIGTICLNTNGVTQSMKAVLADGYEYSHYSGVILYFKKALGE